MRYSGLIFLFIRLSPHSNEFYFCPQVLILTVGKFSANQKFQAFPYYCGLWKEEKQLFDIMLIILNSIKDTSEVLWYSILIPNKSNWPEGFFSPHRIKKGFLLLFGLVLAFFCQEKSEPLMLYLLRYISSSIFSAEFLFSQTMIHQCILLCCGYNYMKQLGTGRGCSSLETLFLCCPFLPCPAPPPSSAPACLRYPLPSPLSQSPVLITILTDSRFFLYCNPRVALRPQCPSLDLCVAHHSFAPSDYSFSNPGE